MPGHWDGDLIKSNGFAVGKLTGPTSSYLILPKGADLSTHNQEELDAIAFELNMRPRKRFDFKCPIEMMSELMARHHEHPMKVLHSEPTSAPEFHGHFTGFHGFARCFHRIALVDHQLSRFHTKPGAIQWAGECEP